MLVLTRKINERILIGDDIRITVVATRGNQVRIGIEAPVDVPVFREELLESGRTGLGRGSVECPDDDEATAVTPPGARGSQAR